MKLNPEQFMKSSSFRFVDHLKSIVKDNLDVIPKE